MDHRINNASIILANAKLEKPCEISKGAEIHNDCSVGAYSLVNVDSVVYRKTNIGRFCSIARNCEIGVAAHPVDWLSTFSCYRILEEKVTFDLQDTIIGNDVWIGAKSIIKNGVIIGNGAVIGAGSVITKNVPPYSIVCGVPGKIIRYRFNPEIIAELNELNWWDIPIEHLKKVQFTNVEKAIQDCKEIKSSLL